MKRNQENLKLYRETCSKIIDRSDSRCEVFIDRNGEACTDLPKKRCLKFIPLEAATWINFLHKETRNGKSDEWINDPNNIVFGCSRHHQEEESTGVRVQYQEYNNDNELRYIPEE